MAKITLCNYCGKEFDEKDTQGNFTIRKECGCGVESNDMVLELDLCCQCIDTIIGECVVSPYN